MIDTPITCVLFETFTKVSGHNYFQILLVQIFPLHFLTAIILNNKIGLYFNVRWQIVELHFCFNFYSSVTMCYNQFAQVWHVVFLFCLVSLQFHMPHQNLPKTGEASHLTWPTCTKLCFDSFLSADFNENHMLNPMESELFKLNNSNHYAPYSKNMKY